MDFDDEEEEEELPLYLRVAKKAGIMPRTPFYDSDETQAGTSGCSNKENSVSLTPPPPLSPPRKSKAALRSLDNGAYGTHGEPPVKIRREEEGAPKGKGKEVAKKKEKEVKRKEVVKVSKALKEAEKLVNKQTDKTEVNKYILVVLDPAVVSSPPGPSILGTLSNPPSGKQEEIFQFSVEPQRVPGLLTWRRKIIHLDVSADEPVVRETWVEEPRSLLFVSAEEVAERIQDGTLTAWADSIRTDFGKSHHLTLMVYNYGAYFRSDKNAQERARKAAVRGENITQRTPGSLVSEYTMMEALLSLSVNRIMDYLTFDKANDKGWKDCAGSVFHQTRAVAEAPDKLKKTISSSANFEFFAKADGKDCISPKNLVEYWKQVIMQVSVVSLEKATAIVRQYPSPCTLIEAYRCCGSRQEAELLLANLEIRRVDTIVGGTRRIGDDISRKVFLALTSTDNTSLLSSG